MDLFITRLIVLERARRSIFLEMLHGLLGVASMNLLLSSSSSSKLRSEVYSDSIVESSLDKIMISICKFPCHKNKRDQVNPKRLRD